MSDSFGVVVPPYGDRDLLQPNEFNATHAEAVKICKVHGLVLSSTTRTSNIEHLYDFAISVLREFWSPVNGRNLQIFNTWWVTRQVDSMERRPLVVCQIPRELFRSSLLCVVTDNCTPIQ